MGDIVYSLPAVIATGGGSYYVSSRFHKHTNYYDTLHRLLEIQPSIIKVEYTIKPKDNSIIFDEYRAVWRLSKKKHLAVCHLEVVKKEFDLAQKWLFNVEPKKIAPIVINKTRRYGNKDWNNNLAKLQNYKDDLIFIGVDADYARLRSIIDFEIQRYDCKDALEIAQIIKGSKVFIGNQSLGFAIAEGMKHPRILEHHIKKDNCRPYGKDWSLEIDTNFLSKYGIKEKI